MITTKDILLGQMTALGCRKPNPRITVTEDKTMNEPTPDTQLATAEKPQTSLLLAPSNFELAQRMATALSKSTLIPQNFQNNLPNCLIALEMANRMGASPMMVMQNLYIVHGKPAWSSQFVIAAINSTGRFSPLRFKIEGDGDKRQCIAWAIELATKENLEGPPVSIAMAKAEGWYGKNGSKWQTMPELMLRYRSATFFGRLYAPEVLMGMKEEGEIIDIDTTSTPVIPRPVIGVVPSTVGNGHSEEPGKKRGRRVKSEPKFDLGPNGQEIEKRLKAVNYSASDLLAVAINNKWVDPPQGWNGNIDELDQVPLAIVGEEKLRVWLENWGEVATQIDALKSEKKDALFA
jgi:hypothetical protein